MSGNLLIRNVRPMAGAPVDVRVAGGVIERVGAGPCRRARGRGDRRRGAASCCPALVDAHMHLDKTFWGLPWRAHEAGPTMLDRIDNERRLRRELGLAVRRPGGAAWPVRL